MESAGCHDLQGSLLMRRPNYRFERAERDRTKQAKKEEKLRKRQQERLALPSGDGTAEPAAENEPHED
jgi:hypothetical protein